jgi:hypothetical protein
VEEIMFVCDDVRAESWSPDFSGSAQASPIWTRVTCRGTQITNSLEWVEWSENPVQVILCDVCGHPGCESGGYVHVSRLGGHVLWSPAQVDPEDDYDGQIYAAPTILRTAGAFAVPVERWNEWAEAIPNVPPVDRLPAANHAAVADAWVLGPARTTATVVTSLRERLVGGDTLDKEAAIVLVERALAHLSRNAQAPFEQSVVTVDEVSGRLETLYLDGPAEVDWTAFAYAGNDVYLALDRRNLIRSNVR